MGTVTRIHFRCHRDMCFPGMRVSRTHIPRDVCFPTHISLGIRVSHAFSDMCFPTVIDQYYTIDNDQKVAIASICDCC